MYHVSEKNGHKLQMALKNLCKDVFNYPKYCNKKLAITKLKEMQCHMDAGKALFVRE